MTAEEDLQHLYEDDFRRERAWLPPHVFALSDGDDPPISDLVREAVWDSVIHLPDDVAIRTTNWIGNVESLHAVSTQWLFCHPIDPRGAPWRVLAAFASTRHEEGPPPASRADRHEATPLPILRSLHSRRAPNSAGNGNAALSGVPNRYDQLDLDWDAERQSRHPYC